MKSVWAIVFLSLLLIEPSASLAIKGGDSSKQSDSGSSGGDKDSNETEKDGASGSSGKPEPMQIGAGFVLGLLLGGGGGSSSGAKGGGKDGSSKSLPSST